MHEHVDACLDGEINALDVGRVREHRQPAAVRLVRRGERDVRLHEGVAAAALRRHQEELGRVRPAVEVRLHVRERLVHGRGLRQKREKVRRHVAQVDRDAVLG